MLRPVLALFAALTLSASLAGAAVQKPEPPSKAAKEIAASNNTFAANLYNLLTDEKKGKNVFFSPYSISTAVAMTHAGANGKTAAEMQTVLQLKGDARQILEGYSGLTGYLNAAAKTGNFQLSVANAFYGQRGYGFQKAYITTLQNHFSANLFDVDFAGATDQSRQRINNWVEQQTNKKITDLMPPDSIDANTRLVLVNAIYFKGDWASPFNKNSTRDQDFHLGEGKAIKAPLMYQESRFRHMATDAFDALSLPYKGGALSMVILLPKENDGLAELEKKLTGDTLSQWLDELDKARAQTVRAFIPKFKTESTFSLNQSLAKLGMPTAFTQGADFSGINGRTDLFIQSAIHKAYVDVNESGTEAAAATGISVGVLSAPASEPTVFKADHPFLFVIRDNATGAVLFMGRVMNPKE
ncbi:MAG: serpin family protein [Phycisphaeraceae bacterium]